jgi:hypothetical protein
VVSTPSLRKKKKVKNELKIFKPVEITVRRGVR